jgi:hypothetical protein
VFFTVKRDFEMKGMTGYVVGVDRSSGRERERVSLKWTVDGKNK